MKSTQPIGIFDSGIGGLTVANALKSVLPNERLVYFGDIAHLPYGEKSKEAIIIYSKRIADFLIERKCKMIVIACNSSSSVAFETVKEHIKDIVPVINVIDPVVEKTTEGSQYKKIGVIGTERTIQSDVYANKIKKKNKAIEVFSLETPLLAPMIEEGFFNNKISYTVVKNYLSNKILSDIDAIILACTHYPLIKKEISSFYKGKVDIIDSAEIVAQHIKKQLYDMDLINRSEGKENDTFFVSDYTESFEKSTGYFFKDKVHLSAIDIWN